MGILGGRGTLMASSGVLRECQSVLSQLGDGAGGLSRGADRNIVMGTWSDPVEGRVASVLQKGSRRWIGKGDVEDAGAGERIKWKPGKSARDVKEGIAELRGPVKIGPRD